MTKSERINLLVSEAERAEINERARRAGVTVSEFLRRAALAYDPDVDVEDLVLLAEEAGAAIDRMVARLDEVHERVKSTRLTAAEVEAVREKARCDFEAAPFALPDSRLVADASGRGQ